MNVFIRWDNAIHNSWLSIPQRRLTMFRRKRARLAQSFKHGDDASRGWSHPLVNALDPVFRDQLAAIQALLVNNVELGDLELTNLTS